MVFFFFLVGMEVRRELQMGELTQRSRLSVPTLAALAGLRRPRAGLPGRQRRRPGRPRLGHPDGHRHRLPARRAGAGRPALPHPVAGLPALAVGGRRHRRAERHRGLLLRRHRPGRPGHRRPVRPRLLPAHPAAGLARAVLLRRRGRHVAGDGGLRGQPDHRRRGARPAGQRLPAAPRARSSPPGCWPAPSASRRTRRWPGRPSSPWSAPSRRTSGSARCWCPGAATSSSRCSRWPTRGCT